MRHHEWICQCLCSAHAASKRRTPLWVSCWNEQNRPDFLSSPWGSLKWEFWLDSSSDIRKFEMHNKVRPIASSERGKISKPSSRNWHEKKKEQQSLKLKCIRMIWGCNKSDKSIESVCRVLWLQFRVQSRHGGTSVRRAAGLRCDRPSAIWNITHGESLEEWDAAQRLCCPSALRLQRKGHSARCLCASARHTGLHGKKSHNLRTNDFSTA